MNKRILCSLAILILSLLIYSFYTPSLVKESFVSAPPSPPPLDKFYYGAIESMWGYDNFDDIGLNLTHKYIDTEWDSNLNRHTPKGWAGNNDHLTNPVGDYENDLRSVKSLMYQNNGSRLLYQRPKIEWLAFGQSSTYEAEPITTSDPLWFYSFNVNSGEQQNDNGRMVLYCGQPAQGPNARYVLEKLKANTEQCRRVQGSPPANFNHWTGDSECDWLIKPMMRIPASFPTTNPETPVCKITVYKEDGQTIKKTGRL